MSPQSSQTAVWISQIRDGDAEATERLWKTYFERMVRVAGHKLRGSQRAVRDEEDVALSAFKSFCLGLQEGVIQADAERENLWPLLVAITTRKAIDQIRHNNCLKRGGTSANTPERPLRSAEPLDSLLSTTPSAELVVAAQESFDQLLTALDDTGDGQLRAIAIASFEGQTSGDLATSMQVSARTVQRKLKTIRAVWEAGVA